MSMLGSAVPFSQRESACWVTKTSLLAHDFDNLTD